VRAAFPEAYFVGEVIHGDYAEIVRTSHLDAVTQYELWKAIWSCLNDRNFFELAWALDRHNRYLGSFCPLTFVGNHDVTRLASRLTDGRHLPGIAAGDAVGANVTMLTVVPGLAALVGPLQLGRRVRTYALAASTAGVAAALCLTGGHVGRAEGLALVVGYLGGGVCGVASRASTVGVWGGGRTRRTGGGRVGAS
jgi:hypothetical protein